MHIQMRSDWSHLWWLCMTLGIHLLRHEHPLYRKIHVFKVECLVHFRYAGLSGLPNKTYWLPYWQLFLGGNTIRSTNNANFIDISMQPYQLFFGQHYLFDPKVVHKFSSPALWWWLSLYSTYNSSDTGFLMPRINKILKYVVSFHHCWYIYKDVCVQRYVGNWVSGEWSALLQWKTPSVKTSSTIKCSCFFPLIVTEF